MGFVINSANLILIAYTYCRKWHLRC